MMRFMNRIEHQAFKASLLVNPAYRRGRKARRAGLKIEDCPHTTPVRIARWQAGWIDQHYQMTVAEIEKAAST
jgi:ribosome modulation factor